MKNHNTDCQCGRGGSEDKSQQLGLSTSQCIKAITALRNLLNRYIILVNSGDAGHWDPESEEEVIAARSALNDCNLSQVVVLNKAAVDESMQALLKSGRLAYFHDADEILKACKDAHEKLQSSLNEAQHP